LYKQKVSDAKTFLADLERERDLTRTWFHIDMDMFYAAVEIRDQPELATLPIAVGSLQMVTTANYVAR
jgi:DNA polymerase kappa